MTMDLLSVDTVAITVFDYPLSYIELVGTVLYLASVWLIARRNMLTWPVGIVSVILYMILFYQIRLYADALEQVYYLGASAYGWWLWRTALRNDDVGNEDEKQIVFFSIPRTILIVVVITLILSGLTGWFLSQAHEIVPTLFPEPAAVPYLDALTTIMSFTAMLLMAQKRIESWVYWIIVDVIGIFLYFSREVRFISLLYVTLLFMAIHGFVSWYRSERREPVLAPAP